MSHHPERTARNVRPVNQPPSKVYHKTAANGAAVFDMLPRPAHFTRRHFAHIRPIRANSRCEAALQMLVRTGRECRTPFAKSAGIAYADTYPPPFRKSPTAHSPATCDPSHRIEHQGIGVIGFPVVPKRHRKCQ